MSETRSNTQVIKDAWSSAGHNWSSIGAPPTFRVAYLPPLKPWSMPSPMPVSDLVETIDFSARTCRSPGADRNHIEIVGEFRGTKIVIGTMQAGSA